MTGSGVRRRPGGNNDAFVRLWDVDRGKEIWQSPDRHRGAVNGVAFLPDGQRVVSCGTDGTVRLWQLPKVGK